MIVLAALLVAQVPPSPSGRQLPYGEVEILDPIVPAVETYSECLEQDLARSGGIMTTDRGRYRRLFQAAMGDCAEVRATAVADAERALAGAPDYQDPARRQLAIRHAFEGTDDQFRRRPEIGEQIIRDSLALQHHRNDHASHK
jgi:hypothetical protein